MATTQEILQWLSANPGATDVQIAEAMRNNGVTFEQMAQATGLNPQDIQSRYQAAISPVQGLPSPTTTTTNRQPITIGNGTSKVTTFIPSTNGSDKVFMPVGTIGNGTSRVVTHIPGTQTIDGRGTPMPWSSLEPAAPQSGQQPSMGNPTPASVPYQQRTSNEQVQQWLAANPGATDSQIRSAMDANGVGVGQLAGVTGMDRADVQARYNAATSNVAPIAGYVPPVGVTPPPLPSMTQTPGSIGNDQITDWLSRNPTATDAQIAQVMNDYGVTPLQMSQATGLDYGSVLNRYNDATGTKSPIANADVADWYSRNQGLGDAEIAQYMNNYGVTPDQLAASIGANPATVQSRYDAATAPATPGSVPPAVAADLSTPLPGYTPPQTGTGYNPMINDLSQHTTGGAGSSLGGLGGPAAGILRGGYSGPTGPIDQGTGGGPITGPNPYLGGAGTPGAQPGFGGPGSFGQYGGYGAFGTQSSPWMSSVADDIMRRTQDALGQSFNAIRSNAVGVGGLGGSRQGVAEGIATRGAMDSMQGQLANLYNNDYQNTQNRGLQAYGIDTNAYLGNQNQWMNFGLGLGGLTNQQRGQDQSFYTAQRGQDLQSVGLGADLYSRGIGGEWAPIQNAAGAYAPFSGYGTTTNTGQQGGGALGALGGALGAGQLAKNFGWFGGGGTNSGSWW